MTTFEIAIVSIRSKRVVGLSGIVTNVVAEGGAKVLGDDQSAVGFRTDNEQTLQEDMERAVARFGRDGFQLRQFVTNSSDDTYSERWIFERAVIA